jgi:phosphoribosylformylglycinamidine synthase
LPQAEISAVADALAFVRQVVRDGVTTAAHDVSDGGLACALAEMAIAGGTGIEADLDPLVELRGGSGESCLFGEGPGGIVLGVAPERIEEVLVAAGTAGVDALEIGSVGGDRLSFSAAEREASVALADAQRAWRSLAARL